MQTDKAYSQQEINSPGVYQIINIVNNKSYIGSSINMRLRKNQHSNQLVKDKHPNKKLQNSFNKYKAINFRFKILEICEKSEIRFREQYYLDTSLRELNISSKAEALACPSVIEARSKKLRQKYYLINPEGIQMCTDNLSAFCEEHSLTRDALAHMVVKRSSNYKYYKEWFITTNPLELKEENRYTRKKWHADNLNKFREATERYFTYMWDTTTDKLYLIGNCEGATHLNLFTFCEEFQLNSNAIRGHFNKNKYNYKNFVIYRICKGNPFPSTKFLEDYYNKHKNFKIEKNRKCNYIYTLISPLKEIFIVDRNLKDFCLQHNLDSSSILKVCKGVMRHTKKWTATRTSNS